MQKLQGRYFLVIVLAFVITSAQAQKKDFYRGYVIDPDGEMIEGWVKDRTSGSFPKLYARIRFKPDEDRGKRKYGPADILAYSVEGQIFESMPVYEEADFFRFSYPVREGHEAAFLKVIAREKDLTYYHWEYIDGESSYVDYIPLFYREGFSEMVRITQGVLGLKRNKLSAYFSDCPGLVHAIQAKQINEIMEVYHFYLDQCLDHEKYSPRIKF